MAKQAQSKPATTATAGAAKPTDWSYLPNPLTSMQGEQVEAIAILREAFPDMEEASLAGNAVMLRTDRYQRGRYLTVDEIRDQWPPRINR